MWRSFFAKPSIKWNAYWTLLLWIRPNRCLPDRGVYIPGRSSSNYDLSTIKINFCGSWSGCILYPNRVRFFRRRSFRGQSSRLQRHLYCFVEFTPFLITLLVKARKRISLHPINLRHLLGSKRPFGSFQVRNWRIHVILDLNQTSPSFLRRLSRCLLRSWPRLEKLRTEKYTLWQAYCRMSQVS